MALSAGRTELLLLILFATDLDSLPPPPLKLRGGDVAQRRVAPVRVVEALDEIEERESRRLACRELVAH